MLTVERVANRIGTAIFAAIGFDQVPVISSDVSDPDARRTVSFRFAGEEFVFDVFRDGEDFVVEYPDGTGETLGPNPNAIRFAQEITGRT